MIQMRITDYFKSARRWPKKGMGIRLFSPELRAEALDFFKEHEKNIDKLQNTQKIPFATSELGYEFTYFISPTEIHEVIIEKRKAFRSKKPILKGWDLTGGKIIILRPVDETETNGWRFTNDLDFFLHFLGHTVCEFPNGPDHTHPRGYTPKTALVFNKHDHDLEKQGALLEFQNKVSIFLEVVQGLMLLHKKSILVEVDGQLHAATPFHGDVKPGNILLRGKDYVRTLTKSRHGGVRRHLGIWYHAVLADLDYAANFDKLWLSPLHTSPELAKARLQKLEIRDKDEAIQFTRKSLMRYGAAGDKWAFGVSLFQILIGRKPTFLDNVDVVTSSVNDWLEKTFDSLSQRTIDSEFAALKIQYESAPNMLRLIALMNQLLQVDPANRPALNDVFSSLIRIHNSLGKITPTAQPESGRPYSHVSCEPAILSQFRHLTSRQLTIEEAFQAAPSTPSARSRLHKTL